MRDLLLGRPVNLERRRSLGDDALGERVVDATLERHVASDESAGEEPDLESRKADVRQQWIAPPDARLLIARDGRR